MATKKAKKTVKSQKQSKSESYNSNRLYRSRDDKMISGVCGGIAEHFNIDPVWIRLAAIITVFIDGIGLLAYVILWILIPENPNQNKNKKTQAEKIYETQVEPALKKGFEKKNKENNGHSFIGIALIIIGALFLIKHVFGFFSSEVFWGLLIIALGISLIIRRN